METKKIIEKLCSIGERQLEKEIVGREFLCSLLKEKKIEFDFLNFETKVPRFKDFGLLVDGNNIKCLPTGLVSGKINNNYNLISSLTSSQDFLYKENINFNPICNSISKANFYFKPSLAVNRDSIPQLCRAKVIKGFLKVEKVIHKTKSLLVGNKINPKNIIFSHFDSIEQGAIDNASGTAVCLSLILENENLLEDSLFVFDSNEEISYDEPIYWGHGYREFEKKYFNLLENSTKILVVDCVGYSEPEVIKEENILKLGFPIKNISKLSNKIEMISGDFNKLMKVYQSPIDSPEGITFDFVIKTKQLILKKLKC